MWRYTSCPVKLGPFDGRLFIILMASLLFMPVIGHYAALIISVVSLISFRFVEQLGLDVNMVFRWLRCWCAGNYQTAAGALFDQPRRRWSTLPVIGLVVVMGGNYSDSAMADFRVTDIKIADKVSKLTTPTLKSGEHGFFVSPPCNSPAGITEIGVPHGKTGYVLTRGNNVPLRTALKAIVPKGWHADKAYEVDGDLPLSWDKGEPFTAVLDALAHEHNLSIRILWKTKTVRILAGCEKASAPTMTETALGKDQGAALLPTKVIPPAPIAKPAKPTAYYRLYAGQRMSEALREWCKMAKNENGVEWTLIWEAARDQPIDANSYYGDHIEAAISKLQETIIGNNIPLRVYQWDNHVIKVTN